MMVDGCEMANRESRICVFFNALQKQQSRKYRGNSSVFPAAYRVSDIVRPDPEQIYMA